MRRLVFSFAMVLWLLLPVVAFAQRAPYTPEQLSLIRHITECKISPDGSQVAFVTDITGALELWVIPASGGWPTQLTNLNEQVADIRWSPDSQWLVFTSDYGGNERRDLFRVPGRGGSVEQLTKTRFSESEPRFSPDGKRLAFTSDPDRDFVFQLHVMDIETRKITRLTHESVKVQVPVWSRDGKTIAINRSGDEQKGDLLLVDAETGNKVVVEPMVKDGILWPEDFAPDGKSLLLTARNPTGFLQLAILSLKDTKKAGHPPEPAGAPTFVGPGKWDVTQARWKADGIYFLRNEGGATSLNVLRSPQDPVQCWLPATEVLQQISLDRSGKKLALLRSDMTRPADVWVAELSKTPEAQDQGLQPLGSDLGKNLKQITFSLMGGVKSEELAEGKIISYESFDHTKIHALFVKPRINRLGSPPPAVVYVHGGPNGQKTLLFDPFIHVLAEAGFAVIAPNYRGSTGYGKAFEDANNKDWGGGDLKDLVAAVKYFGDRGDIDPKRAGITGGSFGGYMTLMALCRAPEVFQAGVERYGMPDLVMDYLLGKSRFEDWYETEMGNLKTHAALYRERSPLPYLDDIKAPLLIFQGAGDSNVPKSESDLLVAVLKELKKKYGYVVYEDEGHGFTKRKNLLDCYQRTTAFFGQHLKAKE
jgi:dipeptidyl aminopeptidase/acylaminoacyl peptidase